MRQYDLQLSVDTLAAILWQYNDADSLLSLARAKNEWYARHHRGFWEDWIRDVFNLNTANDFGLSVWAIILGIKASFDLPPTESDQDCFGFDQYNANFDNGNFGQSSTLTKYYTTEQKRILVRLRYFQLVARCTVPEINRFAKYVFGKLGIDVSVSDSNTMDYLVYFFGRPIGSDLQFLLDNLDILPRPACVGVKVEVYSRPVFGFDEYNQNFDQTSFHLSH